MKTGEVVFNMPVAIANIEIGNVPCMGLNRDSITNSFGKISPIWIADKYQSINVIDKLCWT